MNATSSPGGRDRRTFLFLEGPASPIFGRIADRVVEHGHAVRHICFCLGDAVFWSVITGRAGRRAPPRRRSDWFRGRREAWPAHLADYCAREGVTDVVMLGDGRPVHAAAVEVAMARGIRIHVVEHGYLRPDWLTVEPDGMSGFSRFPRDPAEIRALAAGLPPVPTKTPWRSSFLVYATWDLAYHLPNVALGWLAHPHYRTHGPVHPLVEYGGWIGKALRRGRTRRRREAVSPRFLGGDAPLFLFPLQLSGDYQILLHAPGGDLYALVAATIASFARHAPAEARLLFKIHPLDNGLSRWPERIAGTAGAQGVAERVGIVDGGSLDEMIARAAGVVTVNSTVGTATLLAGKPLIALGNAIFDVPGLTHAGPLADFWRAPTPPDPDLVDAFCRLLVDRIQVRGGFVGGEAIEAGAMAVAERIVAPDQAFGVERRRARRQIFRRAEELFGDEETSPVSPP